MPRTLPAGDDITLAYATPILARVMPDHAPVNAALLALILTREREGAGVTKSNVGGWHSESDLLKWGSTEVGLVLAFFGRAVKSINDFAVGPQHASGKMDASAWANVCRRGDYHQAHNHPSSDWSGVYYVATGTDGTEGTLGGRLELLDPRAGIGLLDTPGHPFTGSVHFTPAAGLLLVFPSWLVHLAHPHEGPSERVSIALNARMISVTTPH